MRSNVQTKNIKQELTNNRAINRCARQCGVIGDETKLKICYLLRNQPNLSVTEIAELVGTSVSNASHSLSKLKGVELVKSEKNGKQNLYSLNEAEFRNVAAMIGGG